MHELNAFVESGKRSVKDVIDRFGVVDWVVQHIGYRVNLGAWSIAGASANGGGFGGGKGESHKTHLNKQLGDEIATRCRESIIEVREKFKPKEGFELSSLLPPEA